MDKLSINELLDSVGINQSILAKLMQVSRSTITRMQDIATPDVIAAIDKYKSGMTIDQSELVPVPINTISPKVSEIMEQSKVTGDYDVYGINDVNHRNIALSCQAHGSGGIDKLTIATSFNLNVFDYNHAVQDTITHCQSKGTSFKELRA